MSSKPLLVPRDRVEREQDAASSPLRGHQQTPPLPRFWGQKDLLRAARDRCDSHLKPDENLGQNPRTLMLAAARVERIESRASVESTFSHRSRSRYAHPLRKAQRFDGNPIPASPHLFRYLPLLPLLPFLCLLRFRFLLPLVLAVLISPVLPGGPARFAAAQTAGIAESPGNPEIEPWMDGLDYSVMDFAEEGEGGTGNGVGNGEGIADGESGGTDGSAEARKMALETGSGGADVASADFLITDEEARGEGAGGEAGEEAGGAFKFDYYDCGDDRARNVSHPHLAGAVESGRKFVMLAAEREQLTKARKSRPLRHFPPEEALGFESKSSCGRYAPLSSLSSSPLPTCMKPAFPHTGIPPHRPPRGPPRPTHPFSPHYTPRFSSPHPAPLPNHPRLPPLPLHPSPDHHQPVFKEHPWARDILSFPLRIRCVKEEHRRHTQDASDALLAALREDDVAAADVILVYKLADETYFMPDVVGPAIRAIEFAPHLKAIAASMTHLVFANSTPTAATAPATIPNSLREQLRRHPGQVRYLAVQWRTEYALLQPNMSARLMLRCTRGLIKAAWTAIRTKGLSERLFLATDMHPDGRPVSMSFYGLEFMQQRIARRVIQLLYSKLQPVSWTTVDPQFPRLDAGVQGILDKLVCLKATFFLYPPDQCGGHSSSFTRDIIGNRRKNRRAFPSEAWSLV
ncbi:unnamed protein product [Closterium sp. NIES-53]